MAVGTMTVAFDGTPAARTFERIVSIDGG